MNILFTYNQKSISNEFVIAHVKLLQQIGHEVTMSLEEFWKPTKFYDFVVINWPDYFYNWRTDISDDEIFDFIKAIENLKHLNSKIVTFFHDEYSHFGRKANLNLMFDLCYSKSDILLHLGSYSYGKYKKIYKNIRHELIHHPLYKEFNTELVYESSRKKLKVKKDQFLIIVPGTIRNNNELFYTINIFRNLKKAKKRLVFLRTSFLSRPSKLSNFNHLKEWFYYFIFKHWYNIYENIFCFNGYMEKSDLSSYFSASDLVIIPRTDILNSGNITLAAQFGKPIIGTGVGNMGELLKLIQEKNNYKEIDLINLNFNHNERIFIEKTTKELIYQYAGDATIKKQWQKILNL